MDVYRKRWMLAKRHDRWIDVQMDRWLKRLRNGEKYAWTKMDGWIQRWIDDWRDGEKDDMQDAWMARLMRWRDGY